MYLGYGYGYGAGAGVTAVLVIVALIAAIIMAIVGYKKYATDPMEKSISISDQSTWGPFLRFDTLLIDKIVKALYIFNALFVAFAYIAILIGSLFNGFGAFLATLVFGGLVCIVVELLVRVFHESIMLAVIVARNTSDIKRMMGSNGSDVGSLPTPGKPQPGPVPYAPAPFYTGYPVPPTSPIPPSDSAAPTTPVVPVEPVRPAPVAPPAPASEPDSDVVVVETVAEAAPAQPGQTQDTVDASPAPAEEVEQSATRICPNCGAVISATAHFCIVCGTKID